MSTFNTAAAAAAAASKKLGHQASSVIESARQQLSLSLTRFIVHSL